MKSITINNLHEVPIDYTGCVKFINGDKRWLKKGNFHREDGPAIIWANGFQAWYNNGQFHREDGPAVVWPNGAKEWYLNNEYYTEEDYWRELHKRGKISNEELFVELL